MSFGFAETITVSTTPAFLGCNDVACTAAVREGQPQRSARRPPDQRRQAADDERRRVDRAPPRPGRGGGWTEYG